MPRRVSFFLPAEQQSKFGQTRMGVSYLIVIGRSDLRKRASASSSQRREELTLPEQHSPADWRSGRTRFMEHSSRWWPQTCETHWIFFSLLVPAKMMIRSRGKQQRRKREWRDSSTGPERPLVENQEKWFPF